MTKIVEIGQLRLVSRTFGYPPKSLGTIRSYVCASSSKTVDILSRAI